MFSEKQIEEILKSHKPKNKDDLNELIEKFSKQLIESMLESERSAHLGKKKYERSKKDNNRNGHSSKKIRSNFGEMDINIPRTRIADFEPIIIKKGDKDIGNIEDKILYMYARGMSERDIADYLEEIYAYRFSAQTVSQIISDVSTLVKSWQSSPLEKAYAVIFLDAVVFKVRRDGIVQNTAVYSVQGIDLNGKKSIIGLWIGDNESSKFWLKVLNELKNRGVEDVFIFCTDNLNGFSQAIKAAFPLSEHQNCIVHQIRNSLKFVSYKEKKELAADLKNIYRATSEENGRLELDEFSKKWDKKYPYIAKSWEKNWEGLCSFFKYPTEIRKLIYTTNSIENYHRSLRRITKSKSSFPSEDSLMRLLFLVTKNVTKKWTGSVRNWGMIYSQLMIFYKDRMEKYV